MRNTQQGFIVPVIIIIVLLGVGVGYYFYSQNQISRVQEDVPAVQGQEEVKLSHHALYFKSPWGSESSFKGGENLGQYSFKDGVRMTVSFSKIGPREELETLGLEPEEKAEFEKMFKFVESKLGLGYSSYDYIKFIRGVTQSTVDSISNNSDKEEYKRVLAIKNTLPFVNDPSVPFTTGKMRGFIYSADTHTIDFWDQNDWRYTLMLPAEQNITEEQINTIVTSLKTI